MSLLAAKEPAKATSERGIANDPEAAATSEVAQPLNV